MSSVASSFPDALDGWRWDGRDRCSSPEVLMMDLHRYSCSPPYFEPPITPMFIPLKTEDLGVSAGRIGWELLLGPPKESEVCVVATTVWWVHGFSLCQYVSVFPSPTLMVSFKPPILHVLPTEGTFKMPCSCI